MSEIDSFVKKVRSGAKIKLESAHNYSQFAQIGEGKSQNIILRRIWIM